MKNIELKGVSNIVNTTDDLEWFMIQFIRKFAEMEEVHYDIKDLEDLEIDNTMLKAQLDDTEKQYKDLQVKYNELRDNYLELYVMYIQAKNKGKIKKEQKDKHRAFRKELEEHPEILDIDLPF